MCKQISLLSGEAHFGKLGLLCPAHLLHVQYCDPPTVIHQIDRFRKHCLWSKGDISRRGTCLAAWELACRTKEEGALGIVGMKNQDSAQLMKFLDKFYNHADIPWVKLTWSKLYQNGNVAPHDRSPTSSFQWKDILKLFEKFKTFAFCQPNQGNSVSFWKDDWSGEILETKYPELFSYTLRLIALFSSTAITRPPGSSSYHCQFKLSSSSLSFSRPSMTEFGTLALMTAGIINGDQLSPQKRPTHSSKALQRLPLFSNGFGNQVILGNINFLLGFSSRTGLTPEIS